MAPIRHLLIDQGSTFATDVEVTDDNDVPLDLTGYTARAQLRKSYGSNSSTAFTVTIKSPTTAGQLAISLSSTQTTALKAGRYVYDIEIVRTSDSTVTRILEGIITVTPEVTR